MATSRQAIKAFWTDAELSVHHTPTRIKALIKLAALLIAIGAGALIGGPLAGYDRAKSAGVAAVVALATFPLLFLSELYEKGGKHGADLKLSVDQANAKRKTRIDAIELVQELLNSADSMPFDEWYSHALMVLVDVFEPFVPNGFRQIRSTYAKLPAGDAGAKGQLLDHIQGQIKLLRNGHINSLQPKYLSSP
jgi:hypothetical protein